MAKASNRREPFFRFCAPDWRSDVPLRRCSFAARGLWIDMISLMHEASPYGELRDGGQPLEAADLAQLLGGNVSEIKKLLAELETRGVFSRCEDGAIYSRRMKRDFAKAEADRQNGKGGGNPALRRRENQNSIPEDNGCANPGVNPPDKAHIHIHIQEEDSELRSAAPMGDLLSGVGSEVVRAPDARTALWTKGMPILRHLTGKSDGQARSLLGKLLQCCENDCAVLLAILQEAADARPVDPVSWLTATAKARGSPNLALVRSDLPTLPPALDPPDAWGVRPWLLRQPDVAVRQAAGGTAEYVIGGWSVEAVALLVMNAAGLPVESRPNLDALSRWFRDDLPVADPAVLDAIRRAAARLNSPPRSLIVFDGAVRDAVRRAA